MPIISALPIGRTQMNESNNDYEVTTGNVFESMGLHQSDELMARAKLLDQVIDLIDACGLSQQEIAKRLGISQPKVSILMKGKMSAFSTDTLLHYLSILGCDVQIKIKKPGRRTAIFRRKGEIEVN